MIRKFDCQVKPDPASGEAQDVARFLPYAQSMSRGNPDLAQELLITALEAVRDRVPKSHVLQRMRFRRNYDWSCRGVENGSSGTSADKPSRRRRPEVLPYDDTMPYARDRDRVDDGVLFKIQYERLMGALTAKERDYWSRMERRGHYARGREAHNGWRRMVALKNQVREKVSRYLEV